MEAFGEEGRGMQVAIGPVKDPGHGALHARFERVYAAHYELILGYALRRTQTRDDAADVVAETALTAWRRFDQAPDGSGVRHRLYGIAHRVFELAAEDAQVSHR